MSPDRIALLNRIESFDIDGGEAALPFAARLAREHGWSRPHADRVIREYKRYVFLAMISDSPVCPSEDVDAAWHLHLTYTRSYWKRFCGEVIGRQLHHDPTQGGRAESDKHFKMYEATLAAYREAFGEAPPADIWTPARERFGIDSRHRVVNTARNWVIPKLPVKRVLQVTAAFVAFAAFTPGCEGGGLNPFNLHGAEFLAFLIPMLIASVCIGRVVRSGMKKPDPQPGDDELNLTWEQTAYLAGGYSRLTTAAIARLAEIKAVHVVSDRLEAGKADPPAHPTHVEQVILSNLPISKTNLKSVQDAVEAKFSVDAARLERDGFLLGANRQVAIKGMSLMPVLLVLVLFAAPRLVMGLADGKPSGYLVATMIVGGIAALIAVSVGERRLSRRGEAVLDDLKVKNAAQKSGNVSDAAMAVALFGTVVLAGSSVAYLQSWYPRPPASSGSGCGSGCGTSSGGDGGGDGGGGSGCGGCGGGGGD